MSAVSLTLLLCLITAVSRVLLKRGMKESNAITGMVISLVVGWLALVATAAVTVPYKPYAWRGIAFFALIGVIAPPVVRYFTYIGVERLGAARSDPVRSLTPFFSIFFAILFFREEATVHLLLGTVMIFLGAVAISYGGSGPARSGQWRRQDLLYPFLAAILAGLIANARKLGGSLLDSSVLGATVAATSALVVFGAFLLHGARWKRLVLPRSSAMLFFVSGLCTAATDVLDLVILKNGKVTVVAPLLASSPLFIIALSALFLRDLERVTAPLVAGALLIFGGVEMILLFMR